MDQHFESNHQLKSNSARDLTWVGLSTTSYWHLCPAQLVLYSCRQPWRLASAAVKRSTHNRCPIGKCVCWSRGVSPVQDNSFRAITDLLFFYGPLQLVQFEESGFLVQLCQQWAVIWQRSIPQKLQNMPEQPPGYNIAKRCRWLRWSDGQWIWKL